MSSAKLIVISTHILEEVEAVCSRAIIIAEGKILADDTPQQLAARSRFHNAIRFRLGEAANADEICGRIRSLDSVAGVEKDPDSGAYVALADPGARDGRSFSEVTALVAAEEWDVTELQLESGRLDDVFRQVTQGGSA
jgi:ABC-2 type transport system ATP-binding protein